jgi:hypothetical protein
VAPCGSQLSKLTMNNGPPTPPLSSATEIEDAARSQAQSAAPETPVEPTTDPEPPLASTSDSDMPVQVNIYHNMLPALCDLAEEENFQSLVLKAELADLNVKSTLSSPFFRCFTRRVAGRQRSTPKSLVNNNALGSVLSYLRRSVCDSHYCTASRSLIPML